MAARLDWADRWAILVGVWRSIGAANMSLIAAGVAFFAMLALFPALGALTSVYGLLADPSDLPGILEQLRAVAPAEAVDLIEGQLVAIASADQGGLQLATVVGFLVALWSSKAGVDAMIRGLTIVYNEREDRGYAHGLLISMALTMVLLAVSAVAILVVVVSPAALALLGLGGPLLTLTRWSVAVATVLLGVGALYRYGPHRRDRRSPLVTWGSVWATALWLAVSSGFSFYVANFASYNKTYGSLGAVIALLVWLFLSAFVVLLGGALDAQTSARRKA